MLLIYCDSWRLLSSGQGQKSCSELLLLLLLLRLLLLFTAPAPAPAALLLLLIHNDSLLRLGQSCLVGVQPLTVLRLLPR